MQKIYSAHHQNDVSLQARARQAVMSIIARQIWFVAGVFLISLSLVGQSAAYSVLVGGISGIIPNFYFADRLMRRKRWNGVRVLVRSMYVGEFLKIGFTIALLVLATSFLSTQFLYLMIGYSATVFSNWFALRNADLGPVP